jgi:hypothetical protein
MQGELDNNAYEFDKEMLVNFVMQLNSFTIALLAR